MYHYNTKGMKLFFFDLETTVAKTLGLCVEDSHLHDAQYDIELTKMIYDIVK